MVLFFTVEYSEKQFYCHHIEQHFVRKCIQFGADEISVKIFLYRPVPYSHRPDRLAAIQTH